MLARRAVLEGRRVLLLLPRHSYRVRVLGEQPRRVPGLAPRGRGVHAGRLPLDRTALDVPVVGAVVVWKQHGQNNTPRTPTSAKGCLAFPISTRASLEKNEKSRRPWPRPAPHLHGAPSQAAGSP